MELFFIYIYGRKPFIKSLILFIKYTKYVYMFFIILSISNTKYKLLIGSFYISLLYLFCFHINKLSMHFGIKNYLIWAIISSVECINKIVLLFLLQSNYFHPIGYFPKNEYISSFSIVS